MPFKSTPKDLETKLAPSEAERAPTAESVLTGPAIEKIVNVETAEDSRLAGDILDPEDPVAHIIQRHKARVLQRQNDKKLQQMKLQEAAAGSGAGVSVNLNVNVPPPVTGTEAPPNIAPSPKPSTPAPTVAEPPPALSLLEGRHAGPTIASGSNINERTHTRPSDTDPAPPASGLPPAQAGGGGVGVGIPGNNDALREALQVKLCSIVGINVIILTFILICLSVHVYNRLLFRSQAQSLGLTARERLQRLSSRQIIAQSNSQTCTI